MLLKFGLRNFKAFRDQSFDLAPITVFVGRNGTGKSSILQALAFLKQSSLVGEATYAARDGAPGSEPVRVLADLGGFAEVVHGGDTALPVDITLEARLDSLGPTPWPRANWEETGFVGVLPVTLQYKCELLENKPAQAKIVVQSSGGPEFKAPLYEADFKNAPIEYNYLYPIIDHPFRDFEWQTVPLEIWAKDEEEVDDDLAKFGATPRIQLRRFFFSPAARGFMGRIFPLQEDTRFDLATTGGYNEFSSTAATALATNRGMEEQISDWLEDVTGLRIRSQLVQIGDGWGVSIVFHPSRSANRQIFVGANNESFGANQLSHVFLEIARAANDPMVGKEATVGIEEPEINLHPRAQRDFVKTVAAIAKQGTQFIISTHSERIVSRILVLVAKGVLRREDIAVYAFDKDKHGVASAEKREIDEMGRIHGGIPGFFEENIEDMSEIMAALKEKA